jgi:hypothetical protein
MESSCWLTRWMICSGGMGGAPGFGCAGNKTIEELPEFGTGPGRSTCAEAGVVKATADKLSAARSPNTVFGFMRVGMFAWMPP